MEGIIYALAELLFAKTARIFLRPFGVKIASEAIATLLGIALWCAIGIIVVALLPRN